VESIGAKVGVANDIRVTVDGDKADVKGQLRAENQATPLALET